MANYTSDHTGAEIDLAVASGSSTTGIIKDFNTLSGSATSTLSIAGDSNLGTVQVTNITASGNISASGTIYADSFQSNSGSSNTIDFNDNLNVSGSISASGDLTLNKLHAPKITLNDTSNNNKLIIKQEDALITFAFDNSAHQDVKFKSTTGPNHLRLDGGTGNTGIGTATPGEKLEVAGTISASGNIIGYHITASGNISSSGTIYGNDLDVSRGATFNVNQEAAYDFEVKSENKNHTLYVDSNKDRVGIGYNSPGGSDLSSSLHIAGDLTTDSHITASGNISASGDISASGVYAEHFYSTDDAEITDDLTVGGDINANGNIVGDDATDITNIETIFCDNVTHDGDTNTKVSFGTDSITFVAGGETLLALTEDTTNTISLGAAISSHITASGNISSSIASTGSFGRVDADSVHLGENQYLLGDNINLIGSNTDHIYVGTVSNPISILSSQTFFNSNITASGNISSSGDVIASLGTGSFGALVNKGASRFLPSGTGTTLTSHQFQGIANHNNFFLIMDKDGEEVMKGTGAVGDSNLTFKFGDNAAAGNGTYFEVDDNNNYHILRNDADDAKIGINTVAPTKPLTVTGDISASGDLYLQGDDIFNDGIRRLSLGNTNEFFGNLSGSSTTTGSFGTINVGNLPTSPIGIQTGSLYAVPGAELGLSGSYSGSITKVVLIK